MVFSFVILIIKDEMEGLSLKKKHHRRHLKKGIKRGFITLICLLLVFLGGQIFKPKAKSKQVVQWNNASQAHINFSKLAVKHYNYANPVPYSSPVSDSYFNDVLFVGDSRVKGFVTQCGLSQVINYSHIGISIETAFTKPVIPLNGETLSIVDAIKKTSFSTAYLKFGYNELGWKAPEIFIADYEELIQVIRSVNPRAKIYVQSILPISRQAEIDDEYASNQRIVYYNQLLQEMATRNEVYYVNVYEALVNENGYLPDDAASDGVHFYQEYALKWFDYLKTHVVSRMER